MGKTGPSKIGVGNVFRTHTFCVKKMLPRMDFVSRKTSLKQGDKDKARHIRSEKKLSKEGGRSTALYWAVEVGGCQERLPKQWGMGKREKGYIQDEF